MGASVNRFKCMISLNVAGFTVRMNNLQCFVLQNGNDMIALQETLDRDGTLVLLHTSRAGVTAWEIWRMKGIVVRVQLGEEYIINFAKNSLSQV